MILYFAICHYPVGYFDYLCEKHPDVNVAFREFLDDILKVVPHQRLSTSDIHCRDAAGRNLMDNVDAVAERKLRMMCIGCGHKAMTTVEVAFSGDTPVDAFHKSSRIEVIPLPRTEGWQLLLRLLHHPCGSHFRNGLLRVV